MKHRIIGRTGRAQLTVSGSTIGFRLLPRNAQRGTSYAAAGDQAYVGSDLDTASLHIRAWTGPESIDLPADMRSLARQAA